MQGCLKKEEYGNNKALMFPVCSFVELVPVTNSTSSITASFVFSTTLKFFQLWVL